MNYKALDEALEYLNEGKILDRIKGTISNIKNASINKNKFDFGNFKFASKDNSITYKLEKASGSIFDKLYNSEAYCAEGMSNPNSEETCEAILNHITKNWKDAKGTIVYFYWCTGKDLNNYYHLTGDNKYPNDLGIFFIDWVSSFDKKFNAAEHKGNFRYFSDVVDNNARREIRAGNKYYDNYHSLYGDDWFYSTI